MDSKKRRLEINRWDHPNFPDSQTLKLFDFYTRCKCDNVGVYGHNRSLAEFHCGGKIDLDKYLEIINSEGLKIKRLSEKKLWIRDFVRDTWGTLAPGNNMGRSAYKLLHKHGLLERFINEYPNCIKVGAFREYITEEEDGYANLPLPQGSPSPAPENRDNEEYEGDSLPQANPRPGTNNNNIPNSNNDNRANKGIHANNSLQASNELQKKETDSDSVGTIDEKPSLYYHNLAKQLKEIIPEDVLDSVSDNDLESDLETFHDILEADGIDQPRAFIIAKAKSTSWESMQWDDFDEILLDTVTSF